MEAVNPVIICEYAYYLSQKYPGILYKICQVHKPFFDCFADGLLRHINKNKIYIQSNIKLHDKLQFINDMYRTNITWLPIYHKQKMLVYATMYDILYPFSKIEPDEVDLDINKFYFNKYGIRRNYTISHLKPKLSIMNGYLFDKGVLLLVAIKYNSQRVANFLMENTGYAIDNYNTTNKFLSGRNIILTRVTQILDDRPRNQLLQLAKIDVEQDGIIIEPGEYDGHVFDYTAVLGNVPMMKLLTNCEYLDMYIDTYALYYAAKNRDIVMINYLLDHHINLYRGDHTIFYYILDDSDDMVEYKDLSDMVEYIIYYMYHNKIRYYIDNEELMEHILEDFIPEKHERIVKLIKKFQEQLI